jgi:DUF1009 family protein
MGKLGLIAGGGGLPAAIAASCRDEGRPVFVLRLWGMADGALQAFEGEDVGLAELGRFVKALKRARCEQVCFAGVVRRPDFASLKPDLAALKYLPGVIAAAGKGDDALLRAILAVFEREGFQVEGVGEAGRGLLLEPGPLGRSTPGPADAADIGAAMAHARQLGLTDIAQGVVVRRGVVLDREDHHGTDAMLERCASAASAGGPPSGVLAKAPKPRQDRRVDLPTIGVATLQKAAAAGLAGVAGEAGAMLVVDKAAVREAADRLGLFVVGVEGGPG